MAAEAQPITSLLQNSLSLQAVIKALLENSGIVTFNAAMIFSRLLRLMFAPVSGRRTFHSSGCRPESEVFDTVADFLSRSMSGSKLVRILSSLELMAQN